MSLDSQLYDLFEISLTPMILFQQSSRYSYEESGRDHSCRLNIDSLSHLSHPCSIICNSILYGLINQLNHCIADQTYIGRDAYLDISFEEVLSSSSSSSLLSLTFFLILFFLSRIIYTGLLSVFYTFIYVHCHY